MRCECRRQRVLAEKLRDIPERFRDASFANYTPVDVKQQQARDRMAANIVGSFYLTGDYGRGKTHLSTAQYRKLIEIEKPCLFLTMAELIAELRRSELDAEYFCLVRQRARYAEHFHLFIDDIDKFKDSEFRFEVLFDLIDTLYRRKLGLTVTSNDAIDRLPMHSAIIRRMDDLCEVIEL